ncbi:MAG: PAS domain S-box protein [Mangrovibacterium sp.]
MKTEGTPDMHKNEPDLHTLIGNLNGVVYRCLIDTNWTMDYISDAVEGISGYPASDFLGNRIRTYASIIHPDDRDRVWKEIREALDRNRPFTIEYRMITREGATKWVWERGRRMNGNGGEEWLEGFLEDISSLKKTENALRESEENLRITLNSIADAVIATDIRGRVVRMNPLAEKLTGWTFAEVNGKDLSSFFHIVHAHTGEAVTNPVSVVLETGQVVGLANHTKLISRDGTAYQISDSGSPIYNSRGQITGVVLVFRDVTADYRMQETLREQEKGYRMMFEKNPQSMWIYDLETLAFLKVNEAAMVHYGYTEEEFLSMTIKDIRPTDDIPALLDDVENTRKDYNLAGEWRHLKKNGEIIFVEIISHSILFNKRRARHVLVKDITGRKLAENKLTESEQKYKNLFDSIRDSILVADTQRKIVRCNPAFTELFGYTESDVTGQETGCLYKDQEEYEEMGRRIRENMGNPGFILTVTYRKKSGELFPGETNVFYLRNRNGEIEGFIGIIRDVTQQKKLQDELIHRQNLMQYIIQHDPNAISVLDKDLRYVYVSERYLNDYRLKDTDIIGKHHYAVFPDVPQKWKDIHARVLQGEVLASEEDLFERHDGSLDYVRWICRPWYKGENEIGGIVLYTEVITERKKIEHELRLNEERFREMVENAPDPIFIQSEMKFVYLNPAACRLFGVKSAQQLIGEPVMERFHPDYHAVVRERIRLLNEGRQPVHELLELRFLRMDDSEVWVETAGEPIVYEGKNSSLVFVRDVSLRKQAEKALKESEQRWQFALEGAGDGVWDWNLQTNEVFFSDQWKGMLGFRPEEVKNDFSEWRKRVHPDDLERALIDIQKHLSGEKPVYQNEHRLKCKDGTYKWILDRGKVVAHDLTGIPIRMIGTHSDIHEKKLAEIRLNEATDLLTLAYDAADLGVWRHDILSDQVYLDERARVYYGFGAGDVSLAEVISHVYPEDVSHLQAEMARVIQPGSSGETNIQYRVVHQDGSVHWLDIFTKINFEGEGEGRKPAFGYGTVQDITRRKETELRLETTQFGIDHARIGVFQVEEDGTIVYVNQHAADNLGYSVDELTGSSLFAIEPTFNLQSFQEHRAKIREQGSNTISSLHRRKDGTEFPVEVTVNYFRYKDKLMSFSFVKDITERHHAEQALRDSELRFRLLAGSAPVGIVISDREQRTLFANQRFTEIVGYTREDLPSADAWWLLVYPDESSRNEIKQRWSQAIRQARESRERVAPMEFPVTCKDGTVRQVEFRLASTGELNFVIMTDITQRKKTDEDLRKLTDELEKQVAEKTRELQERVNELQRFYDATIEREFRIKELRDELLKLKGGRHV